MQTESKNVWLTCLLVWAVLMASALACSRPTPSPTPTPHVITNAGVVKRIESVGILQTTLFRIDTVVRAKKEGSWFFNWGGQNLLLFVQGTVTAGIDLDELSEDNVQVSQDTRTILITLPPPQVLDAILDDYQVENYQGDKPARVDTELLEEALAAGRQQIATTACESGILQYASRDTEAAFAQIIGLLDFSDYQIVLQSSPVPDCAIVVE